MVIDWNKCAVVLAAFSCLFAARSPLPAVKIQRLIPGESSAEAHGQDHRL